MKLSCQSSPTLKAGLTPFERRITMNTKDTLTWEGETCEASTLVDEMILEEPPTWLLNAKSSAPNEIILIQMTL